MAEVARLYYVRDLTQQQIAERLGVSRFKVLRLLEQARSEGVVRFEIDEPVPVRDDLSRALEERFGLATALVVESGVAAAAASLLPRLLRPRDVLGVSWGETLAALVKHLPARRGAGARRADLRRDRGAGARHRPDGGGGALRGLDRRAVPPAAGTRGRRRGRAAPRRSPDDARSSTASRSRSSASVRAPTAPGTSSSTSSTTTGASSPTSVRSRSAWRSCGVRRSSPLAGGRQKRRAVAGALHTGLLDVLVTDAACARYALR